MLTLKRFKGMAESYGGDLRHWPVALRGEAQARLESSSEARAALDAARELDAALRAASAREEAALWPEGGQDAALARLRAGVGAQIAASEARRRFGWRTVGGGDWGYALQMRWIGMVSGSGIAIIFGLLIGAIYAPVPSSDGLLTMLQPAPIHILAD